jgi:integrase
MSDMTWLVILPVLLVIYFIPTIVAAERRQHNLSAIFALNLLLGWTFVWWAVTGGPLRAGVDFPTPAELNLLIEKSEGRWRPFIITAIFTGMRLSELRGLAWENVDLDGGIIHVRQRASRLGFNENQPYETA